MILLLVLFFYILNQGHLAEFFLYGEIDLDYSCNPEWFLEKERWGRTGPLFSVLEIKLIKGRRDIRPYCSGFSTKFLGGYE